ncbi:nucleoside monophosphate kinase [Candidatus Woesearchaeota archaeon]|nr:nucleoside monophosphate kinase [Candidatus Woesearchaeota archaeon]
MIITISGEPGSGKSTIAKALAEKFNLKLYSEGDFFRELAEEKGVSLLELNKMAEDDPSIDKAVEEKAKKLVEEAKDNFVIDGRTAFRLLPKSLKIYLKVDIDDAAKRVQKRRQLGEEKEMTIDQTKENLLKREESEVNRFKKYFKIDVTDESQYDLIIDTTGQTSEESIKQAVEWVNSKALNSD